MSIYIIILFIIVFKKYTQQIFNNYLYMGLIGFLLIFYETKNYNLALFTSLLIIYCYTFYNYHNQNKKNISLLYYIALLFIIFMLKYKINDNYLLLPNFIMVFYGLVSITEFIAHKYVMHNSIDNKIIKNIKPLKNHLDQINKSHIEHHIEVLPNMKLTKVKNERSLFMGWYVTAMGLPLLCIVAYIATKITNYNISKKNIFIICLISLLLWQYVWNKIHPLMHRYMNEYSIKKGPYDNGYFNLNYINYLLYDNHKKHHLQKGSKKGNYNVIILGADEWFNSNVYKVDNKKYCKTHQNEEICKCN